MAFEPPEIADEDIGWVCSALGLPQTAFSGADGTDPRLPVLKSAEPLDVEACPGSGKTTLLVAKLAILARHWTDRQQGVCVLSHTNAARREIERQLGNTTEGQRLLSYPHFIGTIHGFINEFLAIPWLRSLGFPVEMIDDDMCQNWRWRRLPYGVKQALGHANYDLRVLRYRDANIDLGEIRWSRGGTLGKDTATYRALMRVCKLSVQKGFHCHDEMFVWAHSLLENVSFVPGHLRQRFPLLFIDEVQDNSEAQSELLHRIFMEGDNPVVRQRFGDANQAIYQSDGEDGAETDPFPIVDIRCDVPNSFRFGQSIADLADPLAIDPQGLQGQGGNGPEGEPDKAGRHAVFLFDDETVDNVLGAYGAYLLEEFSNEELRDGDFTAIGAVHRADKFDKVPRFVGHYWPDYDSGIAGADPQPATFVQFVMAGRRLAETSGEAHGLVEKLAQGVLKLARIANPDAKLSGRRRQNRYVLELLEDKAEEKSNYLELVRCLGVERAAVTKGSWEENWQPTVAAIGRAIADVEELAVEAGVFLAWAGPEEDDGEAAERPPSDNLFRYPAEEPQVAVRVGSIHSVKGETHTATLVMDTFYYSHHLKALKPWLLGNKSGGKVEPDLVQRRLKLHYVGMTRPARLLCLAMREDALNEAEIVVLQEQGWRIGRVRDTGTVWLP